MQTQKLVTIRIEEKTRSAINNKIRELNTTLAKMRGAKASNLINLDDVIRLYFNQDPASSEIEKLMHSKLSEDEKDRLIYEAIKGPASLSSWKEYRFKLRTGEIAKVIKKHCPPGFLDEASNY